VKIFILIPEGLTRSNTIISTQNARWIPHGKALW